MAPIPICGFSSLNINNWIGINVLVVLAIISIAGFVYALASFLRPEERERLKGISRYEVIEGLFSVMLIFTLLFLSAGVCSAGAAIAGPVVGASPYTNIFNYASWYFAIVMFQNGFNLVSSIFTATSQFFIVSNVAYYVVNVLLGVVNNLASFSQEIPIVESELLNVVATVTVSLKISTVIDQLFQIITAVFVEVFGTLLTISFVGMFLLIFMFPLIKAGALTVVVPISIIVRSLGFFGPKLRSTANLFLALAIGFYFVLPLTVMFDIYAISCLGGLGITQSLTFSHVKCNYPLASYVNNNYNLPSYSPSLLTTAIPSELNSAVVPSSLVNFNIGNSPFNIIPPVSSTFYSYAFSNFDQLLQIMFNAPSVIEKYAYQVASFVFVGIVLVALDMAVTIGFVNGLAKGLDAMSQLFSAGPFFGGRV